MSAKRILIAEDSSVIQNITKKVLQFQQFDIDVVKNGREVIEKVAAHYFDMILLDINMPLMDGMECAKAIRALPDRRKAAVPIVAITGNAKNYSIEDFKAVGINEYISKPINFDNLVATVKKYTA